jgi:hypothetical protein
MLKIAGGFEAFWLRMISSSGLSENVDGDLACMGRQAHRNTRSVCCYKAFKCDKTDLQKCKIDLGTRCVFAKSGITKRNRVSGDILDGRLCGVNR